MTSDIDDLDEGKPSFLDPSMHRSMYLVSHGLRTPVTAIRWGLEMLEKERIGKVNPQQHMLLNELHETSKELTTILRSMLLYFRINRGDFSFDFQKVGIKEILDACAETHMDFIQEHTINFSISCPDDAYAFSDSRLLQVVIMHLFSICIYGLSGHQNFSVEVTNEDEKVFVRFLASNLELPVLQHYGENKPSDHDESCLGGTPGLLIHLSEEIADSVGSKVRLKKGSDGFKYCIELECSAE